MGSRNIPHYYIYLKKKIMKLSKKIIKESLDIKEMSKKTFSSKKQNIILTEQQLETLLKKFSK